MANNSNRRRYPRFKTKPEFRVKARLNKLGDKQVHYFEVENLSMGGAGLVSAKGVELHIQDGDSLEVLLIGKDVSLRCVTKVIQPSDGSHIEISEEKLKRIGLQIVGIDEKSRKILADFLQQIQTSRAPIKAASSTRVS